MTCQRRAFLAGTALALSAGPRPAAAQAGPYRIGMLSGGNLQESPDWDAFYTRMRELGYVEGRNVVYDRHAAAGDTARLAQMARDIVAATPNLIVTTGASEALAARTATSTIPIVMIFGGDPVGVGLAASLARPGGNVTGLTRIIPGFIAKSLELLTEALPQLRRIGVLANPDSPSYALYRKELDLAAARLSVTSLPSASASRPEQLPAAFAKLEQQRPQALFVLADALFYVQRQRVVDFARQLRLPSMHSFIEEIEAGGLMAFTVVWRDLYERAPAFIDKVLKGADPAVIPIEQPTRFGLWINLRTARELGLAIAPSVLLRAEKVIE
ncbi:MAG: ABC transporter substrate-binding protein [Burkholderiaceae bacterium]